MKRISSLALLTTILALPTTARADILYGMNSGILTRIDTDTLTATPIGDTGIFSVSGLEFGPDGQLYGMAPDTDEFIRIDINTGAATVIGPTILNISRGSGMGWDPTTNQMYSVAKLTASSPDILVTVSLDTGNVSAIANVQGIGASNLYGLDFDAEGQLYGVQSGSQDSQLWAVDKSNGDTTPIGDRSLPPVGAFTIAPSGTAWIIEAPGTLYSIDLEDGSTVNHGLITGFTGGEGRIGALASIPSPPVTSILTSTFLIAIRRKR